MSSDIKNSIIRINNEQHELQNQENKFNGEVEGSNSWWKGDAYKSFAKVYTESRLEIKKLYSYINNLEDELRRLTLKVQQADDERIRIETEKKRVVAENKSKEQTKNKVG